MPQKRGSSAIPLAERLDLEVRFLKACFRLVPEMKTTLRDDVLPHRPEFMEEPSEGYRAAFTAWATRFHINVPWVLDAIHNGLLNWKPLEDDDVPFVPCGAARTPFSWEECEFTFSHPGWDPALDNEDEARAFVVTAFNDQLNEHFAKLREKATQLGIKPLPKRRKRVSAPNRRIDWLVYRVVTRASDRSQTHQMV